MDELLSRLEDARHLLEQHDAARNEALQAIRPVVAGVRTTVTLVHNGDLPGAIERYRAVLNDARELNARAQRCPGLWHGGAVEGALQEVAEAWALLHVAGAREPYPTDLVTPGALVLGVADTIGELRRLALDALIGERPDVARTRLEEMAALYGSLRAIDISRGLVDLKRKIDVARQLVDRTRGEVALGLIERRMTGRRA